MGYFGEFLDCFGCVVRVEGMVASGLKGVGARSSGLTVRGGCRLRGRCAAWDSMVETARL